MLRRNRTRTDADHDTDVVRGPSLAKGPALLVGGILLTFGLIALTVNSDFPPSDGFPDASVAGETLLGIEVNGWTNFGLIACGGLLLFGAAQHMLAKTMSLLTGLALGAAAVISAIDGDVLGLGAANRWTALGLAIGSVVLVVNALMPRVQRRRDVTDRPVIDRDPDHDHAITRDERDAIDEQERTRTGRFDRPEVPAEEPAPAGATTTTGTRVRRGPLI